MPGHTQDKSWAAAVAASARKTSFANKTMNQMGDEIDLQGGAGQGE